MNGKILWFTGLSGAGKSTIANLVRNKIDDKCPVEILDGDIVRTNLSKGLGFSKEDRNTNVERIAFVANLLAKHGVVVLVASISPYRQVRDQIKEKYGTHPDGSKKFYEIYCYANIETCKSRDPKGLYQKVLHGEIKNFTGIDDPYEAPINPDLILNTESLDKDACSDQVVVNCLRSIMDNAAAF